MPVSRQQHLELIQGGPEFVAAVRKFDAYVEKCRREAERRGEKSFTVPIGKVPSRVYNAVEKIWRAPGMDWTGHLIIEGGKGYLTFM